jgi:methylated-DNA-[protein]-cysteine S-methyltransferase
MTQSYTQHDTPIGRLLLIADERGLCGLFMEQHRHGPTHAEALSADAAPFDETRRQLDEYFAGRRRVFELPLAAEGTAFQLAVWRELERIPYGETCSYGEIAKRVGRPAASRAVGAANGRNPISIIVPCHRVIGSTGALTGYGGGESRKRWLLEHEATSSSAQLSWPQMQP